MSEQRDITGYWVVVVLAATSPSFGQGLSPPPLVQSDGPAPTPQLRQPPAIANPVFDENAPDPRPQPLPNQVPGMLQPQVPTQQSQLPPGTVQSSEASPSSRFTRIAMSSLLGAGFGTLAAIAGGFLGGEYLRPGLTPIGNIWTGGALGFAVGAPLGVLLSGVLFGGDAPWYAPILGDLVGSAVGVVAIAFGGPDALAAAFVLPLAGSVVGYEVASSDTAMVRPMISALPRQQAAVAGIQGRF